MTEVKAAAFLQYVALQDRLTKEHITTTSRITTDAVESIDLGSFKLSNPSSVTAYELNRYFSGSNLEGTGEYFIRAEQLYGINAVFLAAVAVHESACGSSPMARHKNNLFGWGALDRDPNLAMSFGSKMDCINMVGSDVAAWYLTPGGRCYKGGTLEAVNSVYASDPTWATAVGQFMQAIDQSARQ